MRLNSLEKMFNIKYEGGWTQNSVYHANDVVQWTDGLLYVALTNNSTVPSTSADWQALDAFFAAKYTAAKALVRAGRRN